VPHCGCKLYARLLAALGKADLCAYSHAAAVAAAAAAESDKQAAAAPGVGGVGVSRVALYGVCVGAWRNWVCGVLTRDVCGGDLMR
jgi:hypothetical protein